MTATRPIVCMHCNLAMKEPTITGGSKAHCIQCDAVLYRSEPHGLQISLAFAVTSAALFYIAMAFPIVTVSADGLHSSSTLIGAIYRLIQDDITTIAILVLATTVVMPALQIVALIYLLLPLNFDKLPFGFAFGFRVIHMVKPWAMIEVFMLGLIVTITKLNAFASVKPDIALAAFVLLMLSLTVASANFGTREYWERVAVVKNASRGH